MHVSQAPSSCILLPHSKAIVTNHACTNTGNNDPTMEWSVKQHQPAVETTSLGTSMNAAPEISVSKAPFIKERQQTPTPPPNTTIFLHVTVKHQRRLTSAKEPCRNPLTRSIRCLLPKASEGDSTIDHSLTRPGQHQKVTPLAVAINSFTIKLLWRQQRQLPGQFTHAAASQAPLSILAYIPLNQSKLKSSLLTAHSPQPLTKASSPQLHGLIINAFPCSNGIR